MKSSSRFIYLLVGLGLFLLGNLGFAETIKILPNTVIDHATTYKNVKLDLNKGSFVIKKNATLTLDSCKVEGKLSKDNPVLFNIESGQLTMLHSSVDITAQELPQHPLSQSLEYVIQVAIGHVTLVDNQFDIDTPFAAGLLITSANLVTNDFQILNNTFKRFHGVLYLVNSNNATIAENTLIKNTYGNIVNMGDSNKIIHNHIYFSGNNRLGNAIDIINSHDAVVSRNEIYTPTCHAIYLINSEKVTIDSNHIVGGITYAINLLAYPEGFAKADGYVKDLASLMPKKVLVSNKIKISDNYMAQNRFGLAATDIDQLIVANNIFIQRFTSDEARSFWTNNANLFKNVTQLTWSDNIYKEAYSQSNSGSNQKADMLVPFPATGGIHF